MKNHLHTLVAASALAIVAGCAAPTAKISTMPGMDITTRVARPDYVVIGTATGSACAEQNCFFGSCALTASVGGEELLDGRTQSESLRGVNMNSTAAVNPFLAALLGVQVDTPSGADIAEKIALYKAIESIPDADAILSPRIDAEVTEDWNPITSKVKSCVTVKGKAIRVKPDNE